MAKVRVTIEYEYEGDYDTNDEAKADELKSWTEGAVGVPDIIAAGDHTLTVEIIGDVGDEDVEDEDEDDEKAA